MMKIPKQSLRNILSLLIFLALMTILFTDSMAAEPSSELFIVSDTPVVQTTCDDVSILRYGYTWVPQEAPDLTQDRTFQKDNDSPRVKVHPKKSDEIQRNYFGMDATRMPRSRAADIQPLESIHLIDGNDQTCWMSVWRRRASSQPVWIRLDFPGEENIHRVVLRKRPILSPRNPYSYPPVYGGQEVGRGLPRSLKLSASVNSVDWNVLYEGKIDDSPEKEFIEFTFPTQSAKQVLIETNELVLAEIMYSFSFAELEVYNERDENIAKITHGTGIDVSSTSHGPACEIEVHQWLWPIHRELGVKWVRVGYHDDTINWHHVEKEKGRLEVDPVTDASITELSRQGIDVVMCLNFGNRLYSGPERVLPQLWEWYWDLPAPPTTPEALAAWDRYVEFMVTKYKDRVRYFEIWNEWDISLYWGENVNVENYLNIAHRTIDIIRRCAPDAKILAGSVTAEGFPFGCRSWNDEDWKRRETENFRFKMFKELAPLVDIIGWHPYYNPDPNSLLDYPEDVRAFKDWLKRIGFEGHCMVTEWNVSSFNPTVTEGDRNVLWGTVIQLSELQKTKHVLQFMMQDAGLDLESFFCETYNVMHSADLSFFRYTAEASPTIAFQPQPAFYAVRNLATMMDRVEPEEFMVETTSDQPEVGLRTFTFKTPTGKAVAIWRKGWASDKPQEVTVSLTVPVEASQVTALEPLNGVSQVLQAEKVDGKTRVNQLIVSDSPLLICFD